MSENSISFDGISLHFLDDEAVVFDRRRQRFYGANTSAAVVWSCLEEGSTPDETVEILVGRYDFPRDVALQNVADVVDQWRLWLDNEDDPSPLDMSDHRTLDRLCGPETSIELISSFHAKTYRLLDSVVTMRYETPMFQRAVDRIFAHLATDMSAPAQSTFDLIAYDGGFAMVENGKVREWCGERTGIPVMAKICLIRRALQDSRDFCALHAGAVRRGGNCILLPGESGSGKSTLVAGLAGAGFEIWGDDTAVLTPHSFTVRPVPCGIGLKPGSWPILSARGFPRLAQEPIHLRPDGKCVRYLLPPDYAAPQASASAPVGWIVFPRFNAGAETALTELGKAEALRRLLPGFVRLGGELEPHDVAGFIRWIGGIPCYDLHLSSLDEAITLLEELCA